jgi:hypothetical protein
MIANKDNGIEIVVRYVTLGYIIIFVVMYDVLLMLLFMYWLSTCFKLAIISHSKLKKTYPTSIRVRWQAHPYR